MLDVVQEEVLIGFSVKLNKVDFAVAPSAGEFKVVVVG